MGKGLSGWRLYAATLCAIAFIIGAYVLAQSAAHPPSAQASEESALLAAIATKDTDGDGLPDWEEALYGTDPKNPDTKNLGMTDGQAVAKGLIIPKAIADASAPASASGPSVNPDLPRAPADNTLTAAFSKNLFTLYLNALKQSGGDLTQIDTQGIINQALTELRSSIARAPDFKSAQNLTVQDSGPDAMKAFAASAEAVMQANQANASKSELEYLKDVLQNNDSSAPARIASIAKAYRGSAAGIAALPVPRELAKDDLALINALARLSEVTNDLSLVDSDPLTTMLALDQYPKALTDLVDAFIGIAKDYKTAEVPFAKGDAGASFVHLVDDIAASQKAAAKP